MNCLKNYIQIEGCAATPYTYDDNIDADDDATTNPPAASGLYINRDLPISLKRMDKIADEEQVTFLGLWSELQDRAIKKFALRVKTGYTELYGVCSGLDDTWICENREHLARPLLYFLGSELMAETMISDRINRYTTTDIDKAAAMKADFDSEFKLELKAALQTINAGTQVETGEVFYYQEVLP